MITLPQLITTDTDMTAGLTSGKTTGSAEDFLALLAGALGADGAQGKDARITLADLQAAGGKLSKELLTQHGEPGQAVKLADLLAQKANATDENAYRSDTSAASTVYANAIVENQRSGRTE
ncbi:flagellar hook-length control protein [Salmonella enterica subsp. enterica]|nr:flagellar hook-length control protein [Salmonella enterica subsp. enterica]